MFLFTSLVLRFFCYLQPWHSVQTSYCYLRYVLIYQQKQFIGLNVHAKQCPILLRKPNLQLSRQRTHWKRMTHASSFGMRHLKHMMKKWSCTLYLESNCLLACLRMFWDSCQSRQQECWLPLRDWFFFVLQQATHTHQQLNSSFVTQQQSLGRTFLPPFKFKKNSYMLILKWCC